MVRKEWIRGLERFFWLAGWALLLMTVAGFGIVIYQHVTPSFTFFEGGRVPWQDKFYLMPQMKVLITELTEAFFAFLMSSVFGMISRSEVETDHRSEAFLKITCVGFVFQSAIGLFSWAYMAWIFFVRLDCAGGPCDFWSNAMTLGSYALSGISALSPILYAITIFVLYRHFTRLVKFESEVV